MQQIEIRIKGQIDRDWSDWMVVWLSNTRMGKRS
jgi:hypothetical protein